VTGFRLAIVVVVWCGSHMAGVNKPVQHAETAPSIAKSHACGMRPCFAMALETSGIRIRKHFSKSCHTIVYMGLKTYQASLYPI
jgi:hypothetical protein